MSTIILLLEGAYWPQFMQIGLHAAPLLPVQQHVISCMCRIFNLCRHIWEMFVLKVNQVQRPYLGQCETVSVPVCSHGLSTQTWIFCNILIRYLFIGARSARSTLAYILTFEVQHEGYCQILYVTCYFQSWAEVKQFQMDNRPSETTTFRRLFAGSCSTACF